MNLKWSKPQELEENYLASLMNYNQIGEYLIENNSIQGTIKNVRNNGLLEMEINHKLESFQFKEIQFKL